MLRTVSYLIAVVALLAGILGEGRQAQAAEEQLGDPCVGGAVKAVRSRTYAGNSIIATWERGDYIPLEGAVAGFTVPTGTTDVFVVTFSAECSFFGDALPASPNDYIKLQVRQNDLPMPPIQSPDPTVFCSGGGGPAMHSATFCQELGAGTHHFRVYWEVVDSTGMPGAKNLTGVLNNWTLTVLVSE
jgi:hypothetical protein